MTPTQAARETMRQRADECAALVDDITVAQTILAQLGGSRFIAMTGAKNFVASERTLSMRLPGCIRGQANHARITLDATDTYTVTAYEVRSLKMKALASTSEVYADQLAAAFTLVTGLDTHF